MKQVRSNVLISEIQSFFLVHVFLSASIFMLHQTDHIQTPALYLVHRQ